MVTYFLKILSIFKINSVCFISFDTNKSMEAHPGFKTGLMVKNEKIWIFYPLNMSTILFQVA